MSAELKLMEISEILKIATRSVDFPDGNIDWWEIFESKCSDGHFDALVDEIQENGFGMPIVLCDRYRNGDRWLGNGHHRLCAAILLGLWRIPVLLSEGMDREDFMQNKDSADDENRPVYGWTYEYWSMLSNNMETVGERSYSEDDEPATFYCDLCYDHLNASSHCCLECHREADHICGDCAELVCKCMRVSPEMYAYHWGLCVHCREYGYAQEHMRCNLTAEWEEADDEDYAWQAERAGLVAVGAALPWSQEIARYRPGAWHPESVLSEAYAMHDEYLADEPLRQARENAQQAYRNLIVWAQGINPEGSWGQPYAANLCEAFLSLYRQWLSIPE